MIQAALFDFDGTLVDSLKHIHASWKEALKKHGMHLSDQEVIDTILYATREQKKERYPDLDVELLHTDYHELLTKSFSDIEKHEDVDEVLEALRAKGIKTAVVTFNARDRVDHLLELFDLTKHFDVVLGSKDVERPKPNPDIALKAMEMLGTTPEETVLIGDSEMDMRTGKNAGVFTGLYAPAHNLPYSDPDLLQSLKPDFTFTHYSELLKNIERL
jgi:pyrophosphatase PpaX